ncbi:MAG: helix-turn-helix transcriptional regulator [Corynebacterium sp.]|nr:helix-turn-helix transcriptional regulator [Corynebacterium sp.]
MCSSPVAFRAAIRPGLLRNLKALSNATNDSDFARLIGTSRSTLIAVRDGRREPSMKFVVALAAAFDLDFSEIVIWDQIAPLS